MSLHACGAYGVTWDAVPEQSWLLKLRQKSAFQGEFSAISRKFSFEFEIFAKYLPVDVSGGQRNSATSRGNGLGISPLTPVRGSLPCWNLSPDLLQFPYLSYMCCIFPNYIFASITQAYAPCSSLAYINVLTVVDRVH